MQIHTRHTSLALARGLPLLRRQLAVFLLGLSVRAGGLFAAQDLVVQLAEAISSGFRAFETGFAGHEVVVDLRVKVSGREQKEERKFRLPTFGFSFKHWKAMVRSSVSRTVKEVDCLVAILVFAAVGWRGELLGASG